MKKLLFGITGVLILGILIISSTFIFAKGGSFDKTFSFVKTMADRQDREDTKKSGDVRGAFDKNVETYFAPLHTTSLEDAYQNLGLIVYPEDKVWIFPDPALGIGSRIEIVRAPILYINDGGTKWIGRTWQETIADYMEEVGLALNPNDEVSPHPGTLIESGMNVTITRITKSTFKEEIIIPYKTKYINDNTLKKGKSKVTQKGQNGKKEVVYQIITENGVEVSRVIISETILEYSQNKIIVRGTKVLYKYIGGGKASWFSWNPGTCAYRGYLGRKLRVTNLSNGKSVIVKVVSWGPADTRRIIDLSSDAFAKLAPLGAGIISVKVELVL